MPTYDYECTKCGHEFELVQKMTDKPRRQCPKCRGKVQRKIGTGAGIIFKGSGFYITDYRSEDYQKKAKAEKESGSAESGSGSTGSSSSGDAKGGSSSKESGSKEKGKAAKREPSRDSGKGARKGGTKSASS